MNVRTIILSVCIGFFGVASTVTAQPQLQKDLSYAMEIPAVITMESSPAHLYILSDTEGMVVFRAYADSLQWLYASTGMEQRGNTTTADIRFAYLFGINNRLTVLEPTSVLGVYSSTVLPGPPMDAKRIDQHLYTALGSGGLAQLSLRTPAAVDSAVTIIDDNNIQNQTIIDLEAYSGRLFALSDQSTIFVYNYDDGSTEFEEELSLNRELNRLFFIDRTLMGADEDGNIYEISSAGDLSQMGSISEPVSKIESWEDWLIIQGNSNRVWTSYQNREPTLWKDDPDAGNHFTIVKNQFWINEYDKINRIISTNRPATSNTGDAGTQTLPELSLKPIKDQTIPYPKPLLLALELENDFPADRVQFTYQSNVENANIKGQSLFWEPRANDVGTHQFKIIATSTDGQSDSTSFSVDVPSFNAPPRFAPLRPISIPVNEEFTLPIKALDRDGMNRDLVRYIGVDMPEGASINERTGEFTWTPSARQVGENNFRVIATDQYGAASSVDVSIRVVEATRDNNENGEN